MSENPLPRIYQDAIKAVTDAYSAGVEEGIRQGRDAQARGHHEWLLSADEQLARVAEEAAREALMDAADAWEALDGDGLSKIAERLYRAGGPSMPTIWLRLRAGADETTAAPPAKLLAQTVPNQPAAVAVGEESHV